MKFFEKLFPSETLKIELNISKQEFLQHFKRSTTPSNINFVSEWLEPFSSQNTKFIGNITSSNTFEIKRYRSIFKFSRGLAVSKGVIKEEIGKIYINLTITAFRGYTRFFINFYSIFLTIAFLSQIVFLFQDGDISPILISSIVILVYALIFFFIFKIQLKKAVKIHKQELLQEFNSYTNTNL